MELQNIDTNLITYDWRLTLSRESLDGFDVAPRGIHLANGREFFPEVVSAAEY